MNEEYEQEQSQNFDPYRGDLDYPELPDPSKKPRKPGKPARKQKRVSLLGLLAILLALAAAAFVILVKPVTIAGHTIPPKPIEMPFPTEVKGMKIDGVLIAGAAAAIGFLGLLFCAFGRTRAFAPFLGLLMGLGAGVFAYMHGDKYDRTAARWVQVNVVDKYINKSDAPKPDPKPKPKQKGSDEIVNADGGGGTPVIATPGTGSTGTGTTGTGTTGTGVRPPEPERIGQGTIFDMGTPGRNGTGSTGTGNTGTGTGTPTPTPLPPTPSGPTAAEKIAAAEQTLADAKAQLKPAQDNVMRRLVSDAQYKALNEEVLKLGAEVDKHPAGSTERFEVATKRFEAQKKLRKMYDDAMVNDAEAKAVQAAIQKAEADLKAAKE